MCSRFTDFATSLLIHHWMTSMMFYSNGYPFHYIQRLIRAFGINLSTILVKFGLKKTIFTSSFVDSRYSYIKFNTVFLNFYFIHYLLLFFSCLYLVIFFLHLSSSQPRSALPLIFFFLPVSLPQHRSTLPTNSLSLSTQINSFTNNQNQQQPLKMEVVEAKWQDQPNG